MLYSYFKHPNQVCMSYFKHCKLSLYFAGRMLIGSLKATIHAFLPYFYKTSTSTIASDINIILQNEGCRNRNISSKDLLH
jgi:hypothetical protein